MRRASQSLTGERKPKADRNDLVLIEHVRRLASAHESGLSSDIVTITPGMAYEWMERGGENRPLNQSRIQRYAAAMVAGDWRRSQSSPGISIDRVARSLFSSGFVVAPQKKISPFQSERSSEWKQRQAIE